MSPSATKRAQPGERTVEACCELGVADGGRAKREHAGHLQAATCTPCATLV